MNHLRSIQVKNLENAPGTYPFNLPFIQKLPSISFNSAVTFFVGENGSGKSTLIETIAAAVGSIVVGSENFQKDKSMEPARKLADYLQLTWNKRTHRGFFLRAEDFFGYAKRMALLRAEMQADLEEVRQETRHSSKLAQDLAESPFKRELYDMKQNKSDSMDLISHGESFLQLFQSRFVPNGLYLLDEPEAPLSPLRQLSLITLIKQMVAENAQFIIATHSPILMAFPGAEILSFDEVPIKPVAFNDLQHVEIMRGFLNNPTAYLNHL
ncbi:MAG: AAA family ATPase [Anaerolineaceae bacterium]|jgi:predicted ATPase|nr:AAA family ATPase [Anaerolineaceae bacterium]